MARNYKRSKKSSKSKAGASPWTFLASGFALGLVAALILSMQMRPAEVEAPKRPVPNSAAAPQSSIESEATVAAPEPESTTKPVTEARSIPKPVESDYDFYDVLPDFEVVIADEDNQPVVAEPAARRPARPAQTPDQPANYILQAGSFRKFVDADRRKAELAFKGIESNIQQVVLKEEEIWYRVYVGPGTDFATFENMRSTLRRANIDVLILKVRK